jgi:hypothetical protein
MILLGAVGNYAQPLIDYHQHLLSPSAAELGSLPTPFTARDLIALLDAAGSGARWFYLWLISMETLTSRRVRMSTTG